LSDALLRQLRELPDDWESWLVYADALSERGDLRGELLVAEHRGAPEAAALADDWMLMSSDLLRDDDLDAYEAFRRWTVLAPRAAVFARPLSQLIALLEPGQRAPGLSPVFARHREEAVAAVLDWIDRAFDGVPAPDLAHRTIHQAEAADNYESCDRSRDHLGRWQDLPESQLLDNQWALAHLDVQGILYYLPAVMSFALRHVEPHPRDHWITESLEYTIEPSKSGLREYQQGRFAQFDREQRAAIYAFALVRRHDKAAAAWARVFEAELHGARADWFELYSPAA
jgi:uncharacterized protein (TIGR02996 family)